MANKVVAKDGSTVDEVMAETVSMRSELATKVASTVTKTASEAASTADKLFAEAASTAFEGVVRTGPRWPKAWLRLCLRLSRILRTEVALTAVEGEAAS